MKNLLLAGVIGVEGVYTARTSPSSSAPLINKGKLFNNNLKERIPDQAREMS